MTYHMAKSFHQRPSTIVPGGSQMPDGWRFTFDALCMEVGRRDSLHRLGPKPIVFPAFLI